MGQNEPGLEKTDLFGTIVKINAPYEVEFKWHELESKCNHSFFLTWEWIGPWANLVSKNTELYLFTATSNGTYIAMCFLTIAHVKRLKGLIRVKQLMLNEFINKECNMVIQYNGMLVNDSNAMKAWQCFCDCIMAWNVSWDELAMSSILQPQIDNIYRVCQRLILNIDKIHNEWKILLRPEFGEINSLITYFKSKSRHQLRQSLKAFEKELGPISIKAATNAEDALKYFENMGKLHTERWIRSGEAGSFANHKWVDFHKEIIRNEFKNGLILLFVIKSGEMDIGYLYGHVYNNVAYMQQTGFALMKQNILKPGYVSHLFAISACAANGINQYNFLPDDDSSYKKFFTTSGDSVYWVFFQKKSIKSFIEKCMRRLYVLFKRNIT